MKPQGLKPTRFPSKRDMAPPGYINWWEEEIDTISKPRGRREAKKDVVDGILEWQLERLDT